MAVAAPPAHAFDHHLVASLASVRSDGRPHVVPLWFVWDGMAFVMYSKPHAVKVQNLRRDPNAMLAIGEPGLEIANALVEVRAEMVAGGVGLLTAYADKYAQPMARLGLAGDAFAAVYSQPIRLIPIRWLSWGGIRGVERRCRELSNQSPERPMQTETVAVLRGVPA